MVQLASQILQLRSWFRLLRNSGPEAATSSDYQTRFHHWHVRQDSRGDWRVVDDFGNVVCLCWRQRSEAEQIATRHNEMDPIKTYEDWLYYREKR